MNRAAFFAAKCESPRSGASAVTGRTFPDTQGTGLDERNWLRSWTNELYLWYREVPDLNPASYTMKGVNAKDFGDYSDGFSPQNTASSAGERIPGCSIADDFNHPLGSTLEGRLAAALNYRLGASCPAPTGMAPSDRVQPQSVRGTGKAGGLIQRPFWRENRIL